ncbi:MAG TPA: ankyrin repeat domain-containing protein [Longimicrobium sp.]|nr:ankyrin repeat domain-containing protein [Longimicrobium sp.]
MDDFLAGQCSRCGRRRADTPISDSRVAGIGYRTSAASAREAFAPCLASLRAANGCAPLQAEGSPEWADWCEHVTGQRCHGCFPVVSAAWLLRNPRLLRHDAMPREAFVPHTRCDVVLFVSHRWESPARPDVRGRQALFLRLFLAARLDPHELPRVGIWYDYSVLPQKPLRAREQAAYAALLPRIPEIQARSHTLVCGDVDGIRDYAARGWCLLEYHGGTPVSAEYASGEIPYRVALGHAVARDEAAAVLHALAYVVLRHVSLEEAPWRCPGCGTAELDSRELKEGHRCLAEGEVDPEIRDAWARLDQIEAVTRTAGVSGTLPEYQRALLRRRGITWREMRVDFEWARHCGECRGAADAVQDRRATMEEAEVMRTELSLCRDKSRRLLLHVDALDPPAVDDAALERAASWLGLACTERADVAFVMRLMAQRADRLLTELASPSLVERNGATAAHHAAKWQDLPMLTRLVARNPHLLDARDSTGWTLLHYAVFGCDQEPSAVVDWLLGVRPGLVRATGTAGDPPIAIAVRKAGEITVRALLDHAPELAAHAARGDESLLHLAAWHRNRESSVRVARVLLDRLPALVDRRDVEGRSVLHAAARTANVPLARLVAGIRPSLASVRDRWGDAPLHSAIDPNVAGLGVDARVAEMVRFLVQAAPGMVETVGGDGLTPLQLAEGEGPARAAVVEFLRALLRSDG